ncbi:inorganic phosphate transporter, PiT family [Streptomyces sp. WMMB 714]|uniref:inorganic phosphate transporter n=1 Tax=Streptomyces sp. WMMB 714 TaxID=1286822 RepID=UPI0005F8382E|nr:inorganic phosphate transporter [Streptomyces sp. WMMB 714]SCK23109.1 inorganic phosphate transporter, PiT family [Streptomyces sp. WMMB 714]
MSFTTVLVLVLVAALAAANGGNDVPKGVATLAGAGVTKYRTAILWGTVTTFAGCVCSLALAEKMTKLFSKGIVTAEPTEAFAVAVLAGTVSWVALATVLRLPVSTTHALIGALLGAGTLFASSSIAWSAIPMKLVIPLLVSVGVAYGISLLLALLFRNGDNSGARNASSADSSDVEPSPGPGGAAPGTAALLTPEASAVSSPPATAGAPDRRLTALHWTTSGATGFARGLNDTPKIVAIGAFALVPAGMTTWQVALLVAVAMAVGSLTAGMRVAERLGEGVIRMNHKEGFLANLTTATLVGLGAGYGLPMSTTHTSTGAIAGSAGADVSRLSGKTLRDFLVAWIVTPPFAAAVAAVVFLIAR